MTPLPLALLLAASAGAVPRPPGADAPKSPPSIDPSRLSSDALARYEADPAGFEREHGETLETMRRWSQDPALGQSECIAAKQDPRACMEDRLADMREVAKPEQLAVIQSYVKLLPRGVSAALPGEGSASGAAASGSASGASTAPTPPAPRPAQSEPRQSGVRFNAAPTPPAQPTSAQPGGGTVQEWMDWLCSRVYCGKA